MAKILNKVCYLPGNLKAKDELGFVYTYAYWPDSKTAPRTAEYWAKRFKSLYGQNTEVNPEVLTLDNLPIDLKIVNYEKRDKGNTVWVVRSKHPQTDFVAQFELTNDQLLDAITTRGIASDGTILGKFQWISGGKLLLINGSEWTELKRLEETDDTELIVGAVYECDKVCGKKTDLNPIILTMRFLYLGKCKLPDSKSEYHAKLRMPFEPYAIFLEPDVKKLVLDIIDGKASHNSDSGLMRLVENYQYREKLIDIWNTSTWEQRFNYDMRGQYLEKSYSSCNVSIDKISEMHLNSELYAYQNAIALSIVKPKFIRRNKDNASLEFVQKIRNDVHDNFYYDCNGRRFRNQILSKTELKENQYDDSATIESLYAFYKKHQLELKCPPEFLRGQPRLYYGDRRSPEYKTVVRMHDLAVKNALHNWKQEIKWF